MLVTSAIGLTFALAPHGRELALLRIQAGDPQTAVVALEGMVAAGDRSPATLEALARALAGSGNVAAAAQLLEGLVAERPGDRAVLEALVGFQRSAGRTNELIRTLESLQTMTPQVERQRELARLLGEAGRTEDRRRALRALVEHFAAEAVDYVALARSEQAAGNPATGASILQQLAARHPAAADASVVALQISMLIASGEAEQALVRSRQWLERRGDLPTAAAILGGAFSVSGRPDLAVILLTPLAGAGADPELVASLAQAESDAGHPEDGLRHLEALGPLADPTGAGKSAMLRLRLALAVGDTDRAVTAAEIVGLRTLPPDLLARLSRIPLASGRIDTLRHILDAAGESFLQVDAILAARIELALGDTEAARRWSARAARQFTGQPALLVEVADVELRLERKDRALEMLSRAAADQRLPPSELVDVARLYMRAGRAAEGTLALDAARRRQPSLPADSAWALVATASGHAGEVGMWLSAYQGKDLSPDVLRDLVYLATDAGAAGLAVAAAERLYQTRGGGDEKLLLARVLLKANQARRALDLLRPLSSDTAVPSDLYEAVLLAAWRQHAPVADELRTIGLRRLAAATAPSDRDAAVFLLLELRAYPELLPVLRRLAEQDPARWLSAFGDAATAEGRRAELPAFWTETAMRPTLPIGLRRQLAFRVLEAGDKPRAEQVFRSLALTAPPTQPDVRMLMFLWGPRPSAEQLDWIEARARRAGEAETAEWMNILISCGAPARAIAAYRTTVHGHASDALSDSYTTALYSIGDRTALAAAIREQFPLASSVSRLKRLAQFAEGLGNADLEKRILEKLILVPGGDGPEVQRRLGTLAFQRRNMVEAQQHLSAYVVATGGDYESLMLLGNIALRKRDADGARAYYANGLRMVQASTDRSFRTRVVEANLLHRLDRDEEADSLYVKLLAERPDDTNLRADFTAMLMVQNDLRRARAVLNKQ
jgi:predicted Zn-dependent protease